MIRTAAGILAFLRDPYRESYIRRKSIAGSLSKLSTHHLRTAGKFFSLRFFVRSLIDTSENVARIPVSILPLAEYLWHSFRTLLQSGKCLLMSSTILSYHIQLFVHQEYS